MESPNYWHSEYMWVVGSIGCIRCLQLATVTQFPTCSSFSKFHYRSWMRNVTAVKNIYGLWGVVSRCLTVFAITSVLPQPTSHMLIFLNFRYRSLAAKVLPVAMIYGLSGCFFDARRKIYISVLHWSLSPLFLQMSRPDAKNLHGTRKSSIACNSANNEYFLMR